MPDYRFEALGSRSFEQLVQSLAIAVLTPGVTPFGDGRDGGREATFDGPTAYVTSGDNWNGYGVVQAKFLQRPLSTEHDGKWALAELKKELRRYSQKGSQRRLPEYYLFATNANLSSVQDVGTKDTATKTLNKFANDQGLRGFDIWDYDKLRAFLDNHPEIRTTYDAWLTVGDVLASVISSLDGVEPNFHSSMTKLIARELLDNQYARLEQAGHSADVRVPLASVFVDIPFADQPHAESEIADSDTPRVAKEILEAAQLKLDPATQAIESGGDGWRAGRYVLIGGPGQGKTTVAQFVCQLFRAALLEEVPQHLLEHDVRAALRTLEQQRHSEDLGLPSARRFPVHIVLNELAHFLSHARADQASFLYFLADRISNRLKQVISTEGLRRWLVAYPWLLVFDGLDEVPASTNRDDVLAVIQEFLLDARADNVDLLVLATSRPQGYSADFSPRSYQHMWLTPLSDKDAIRYGSRLVEVRYGLESDRGAAIMAKLVRASKQESVSHLMRSPLQVTIMAQLVDRVGQPPQERYTLFREYYDVIYSRELERDIPAAAILREYRSDIDSIHWRLGLTLQARSEVSGGTEATLTRSEFAALVKARLHEEEHVESELQQLTSAITEAAAQRLVFLVGHESDAIGFEIRSLQEFMAAEALHEGAEIFIQSRLRQISVSVHWRNVYLFAAGRCFAKAQSLRDTIVLICHELNDGVIGGLSSSLLRTGSDLALEILEDGSCRRQPKYARHLLAVALRIAETPPGGRHERLAGVLLDLKASGTAQLDWADLGYESSAGGLRILIALSAKGNIEAKAIVVRLIEDAKLSADLLLEECVATNAIDIFQPQLRTILPFVGTRRIASYMVRSATARPNWKNLPPWMAAAFDILTSPHLPRSNRVSLATGGSRRSLSIPFSSLRKDNRLADLAEMPYENGDWTPVVAAAKFARVPTARTLSDALTALGGPLPRWLLAEVPWPLATLFGAFRGDYAHAGSRARAGELGDIDSWVAAEERWQRDGVTIDDLKYVLDLGDVSPFDANIAAIGFPVIIGGTAVIQTAPIPASLLDDLIAIRRAAHPSAARVGLSRMLLRVLDPSRRTDFDRELAHAHYEALMDVLSRESAVSFIRVDVVDSLRRNLTEAERARLYGSGPYVHVFSDARHSSYEELAQDVIESFRRHPELPGHIRTIASLAEAVPVRHLLRSKLGSLADDVDEEYRPDLALLTLAQNGPDPLTIDRLIGAVDMAPRPNLANRADEILAAQGSTLDERESLILRLSAADIGTSTTTSLFTAPGLLERLARGRPSGIEELESCLALGLPRVISDLAMGGTQTAGTGIDANDPR